MNQEKIGHFITKCRKEKNMTQQELANVLGVTDRAISKWENGRGMPDYSLIKPLCNELGISINELLSGEKIKVEEEQKKFEENVLNTLNYTSKKINRIKKVLKTILISILLIAVTILILFGIDYHRMIKGKPVIFSTWGYLYTPNNINLDDLYIERTIKEYLIKEDEKHQMHDNEKSFVAMKIYSIKEKDDEFYAYAWVVNEKWYEKNTKIIKDTGSSIPYKFTLIKQNGVFSVTNAEIPRDGSLYYEDMKKLFPRKVLKQMDKVHYDGTIEKLLANIEEQVELYFHEWACIKD